MSDAQVVILGIIGDPIEQEAVKQHELGELFPRYAEFWATYVWPNRDRSEASKLREGFPVEIEDIFNNHYYAFYQLTITFRQITDFSKPVLDVGDPLYHLGTSIDLIERTFVAALRVKGELTGNPIYVELSEDEFLRIANEFWSKEYSKRLEKFKQNYRPVSINFHNIEGIFDQYLPKSQAKKDFQKIAGQIRNYRNVLTHSLPPLKLTDDNFIYLPKQKFLNNYLDGRWSSGRHSIDPEHYAPAHEIIKELATKLVSSSNDLWETLLLVMSDIATHPKYKGILVHDKKLFVNRESSASPFRKPERKQSYTGGSATADHKQPTGYNPPSTPSAYEFYPKKGTDADHSDDL